MLGVAMSRCGASVRRRRCGADCGTLAWRHEMYRQPFGKLLLCVDCYCLFVAVENEVCEGIKDAGHTADTLAFLLEDLTWPFVPVPRDSEIDLPF